MPVTRSPFGRAPSRNAVRTAADDKLRTSALAGKGPTKTKVPSLFADWHQATVLRSAEDAARHSMSRDVDIALDRAEQQKGAPLDDDERDEVVEEFFDDHRAQLSAATQGFLTTFDKSPASRDSTVDKACAQQRPRIGQRRDPFTPVAQGDPQARARELVLWENPQAMVLVDLFAHSPKALVVPKQPMMLPVDAPPGTLDELALLSAHVSDAFAAVTKAPPAGIWINAPQDITVKQLHVHVLPDLPEWSGRGVDVLRDPRTAPAAQKLFDSVAQQLAKKLGPSS